MGQELRGNGKSGFLRVALFIFAVTTGCFFTLVFISNPVTDRILSFYLGDSAGSPIGLEGVRIRFFDAGALFSIKKVDMSAWVRTRGESWDQIFRELGQENRLIVKDSKWVVIPRNGGWNIRLLRGAVGGAGISGGFFLKDGEILKLVAHVRIPEKILHSFSQLAAGRFPREKDGGYVVKVSFNSGRWVLWGAAGPVLEAKWR